MQEYVGCISSRGSDDGSYYPCDGTVCYKFMPTQTLWL